MNALTFLPCAAVWQGAFRGKWHRLILSAAFVLLSLWSSSALVAFDLNSQRVGTFRGVGSQGGAGGLAIVGDYMYVADGTNGLQVLDIRDRTNLKRVGGYATENTVLAVEVAGSHAYVAADKGGMLVFDVSDPTSPRLIGGHPAKTFTTDVALAGSYAYLADTYTGLQVLDISEPAHPVQAEAKGAEGLMAASPGEQVPR